MPECRPSSMQEFLAVMERFRSKEAQIVADNMLSQRSDVFISTFAKSGTTWMQQIVHQLRTGTDESFEDIYEVVPWIENAFDMNIDLAAPQPGQFRVFKSHMSYQAIPKASRYITVLRHPADVICSWFRFFEGWLFETDSISLDEFATEFYLKKFALHQAHYQQWFERVGKPDTLILCYEDMVANPSAVPRVVADFLNIVPDEDTMRGVIRNSSREYMYQNRDKFEERLLRRHIDKVLELPVGGASTKVNQNPTKLKLSKHVLSELSERWNSTIGSHLGFQNYEQLRAALPNSLRTYARQHTEPAIKLNQAVV